VDFAAAEIGGGPVETGLAARAADHQLMAEVADRRGRGPVWRLVARLVDVARLAEGAAPAAFSPAPGFGVAEASRGTLVVRGATDGAGRVTAFARLTPTDAALHPRGALARALAALPADPAAPLAAVAALTVEGIDPCVPWRLTLREAAHA
jgi:hypothetical protein